MIDWILGIHLFPTPTATHHFRKSPQPHEGAHAQFWFSKNTRTGQIGRATHTTGRRHLNFWGGRLELSCTILGRRGDLHRSGQEFHPLYACWRLDLMKKILYAFSHVDALVKGKGFHSLSAVLSLWFWWRMGSHFVNINFLIPIRFQWPCI